MRQSTCETGWAELRSMLDVIFDRFRVRAQQLGDRIVYEAAIADRPIAPGTTPAEAARLIAEDLKGHAASLCDAAAMLESFD